MNKQSQKTILLVEDEVLIAMNEASMLKKYGYEVITAVSAKKAIDTVKNNSIDLILMDIDLGHDKMDGTDAAGIILKEHDIPIVFLSSHSEPEVVEKTEKITSYGYVVKNSSITVIDASIKMAFKLYEAKIKEREKENLLRERDIQFRKLSANVPDLIFQFTRKPDGSYCVPIASAGIKNIFGCSPEDVIDDFTLIASVIFPEDSERVIRDIEYSAEHLTYFTCEFRVQIPGKSVQWIFSRSAPEKLPDGSITWYGFNADITELKKVEEELKESELNLKSIIENSSNIFYKHNISHKITFLSPQIEDLLGYKEKEAKRLWTELVTDNPINEIGYRKTVKAIETGEKQDIYELEVKHKDGHNIWVEVREAPIVENGKTIEIVGVLTDITKRKEAEEKRRESNERFRIAQDMSPDGFTIFKPVRDDQNRIIDFIWVYQNAAIAQMNGTDPQKVVGKSFLELFPGAQDTQFMKVYKQVAESGKPMTFEDAYAGETMKTKSWFRIVVVPMDENIAILAHNTTERKQAEEKLREALIEKDYLMKELNHRVKNSLLMVSSLISLKSSETEMDFSDIQHQVEAISLIHEKLYQRESITEINCKDYFEELLNSIFRSFTTHGVKIENSVEDINIPTKAAMSLGLIINEIATNAIKHGFTDNVEAVFSIKMKKDKTDSGYKLTLSNTGNPFPTNIGLDNPKTMGLQLISALVDQVEGTIELQREPHPVFTMRFPMKDNN